MKKLIVFPFNGNGLEALNCIGEQYELIGFADDTPAKWGKKEGGFEVFAREIIEKYKEAFVLAVPGNSVNYKTRCKIIEGLHIPEHRFASVIHPKATITPLAKPGYNLLLMANVVITSNGVIGNHVCMLPNSVLHHDSVIGNYSLIGSNVTIAGGTFIGENCYIGSSSSFINGIKIGDGSLVGIGSNVIRSFPENSKIAGNPARSIP